MNRIRFLVDESVGKKFADILKNSGVDVLFGGDDIPETSDKEVVSFAKQKNLILITADKDFGELIFRLGMAIRGVIFIRAKTRDPEKRFELLKSLLDKAEGKFIVVKEGQVRIRELK